MKTSTVFVLAVSACMTEPVAAVTERRRLNRHVAGVQDALEKSREHGPHWVAKAVSRALALEEKLALSAVIAPDSEEANLYNFAFKLSDPSSSDSSCS